MHFLTHVVVSPFDTHLCSPNPQIKALFPIWNTALASGDPKKVAALYTSDAVLLGAGANSPRTSRSLVEDYFKNFLKLKPFGRLDKAYIRVLSDTIAINSALCTFKVRGWPAWLCGCTVFP